MPTEEEKFEEIFAQSIRTDFELDIEQKILDRVEQSQALTISRQKYFAYAFLFFACCLCPFSLSIFDGVNNYSIEWFMPMMMVTGLLVMLDNIINVTKPNSS